MHVHVGLHSRAMCYLGDVLDRGNTASSHQACEVLFWMEQRCSCSCFSAQCFGWEASEALCVATGATRSGELFQPVWHGPTCCSATLPPGECANAK